MPGTPSALSADAVSSGSLSGTVRSPSPVPSGSSVNPTGSNDNNNTSSGGPWAVRSHVAGGKPLLRLPFPPTRHGVSPYPTRPLVR